MIYNTSNMTAANNIYETAFAVAQMSSLLGPLLVFMVGLIIMFSMMNRYSFSSTFLSATFSMSIVCLFLRPVGLISTDIFVIVLVMTAAAAGLSIVDRRSETQ